MSKWPAAGQGLQITKWPAIFQLFPEIYEYLSIESPLYFFIKNHQALALATVPQYGLTQFN